jgi:hypothetical protein
MAVLGVAAPLHAQIVGLTPSNDGSTGSNWSQFNLGYSFNVLASTFAVSLGVWDYFDNGLSSGRYAERVHAELAGLHRHAIAQNYWMIRP